MRMRGTNGSVPPNSLGMLTLTVCSVLAVCTLYIIYNIYNIYNMLTLIYYSWYKYIIYNMHTANTEHMVSFNTPSELGSIEPLVPRIRGVVAPQ